MKKTKLILAALDKDPRSLTKSEIKMILKETKEHYPTIIEHIRFRCPNNVRYSEIIDNNVNDYRLRNMISYMVYFEYHRYKLLSFDDLVGVYHITAIYSPKEISNLWFYIQSKANTVVQKMCLYTIIKDTNELNSLWSEVKGMATGFNDYKEMYENTPEYSDHWGEAIELLHASAKTEEEKAYVIDIIKEFRIKSQKK